MRNFALYILLRAAAWVLPRLPLKVAYALACTAGSCSYFLVPAARRGIRGNLVVAFPDQSSQWQARTARRAFQNDAKNWIDTLRIARLSAQEIEDSVRVEGWEHLTSALRRKNGVILVTLHVGNFDLVGQIVASRGLRLTVPVERISPPQLFDFLVRQRASRGITILPLERSPRVILRELDNGGVVGIAVDRVITGRTTTVEVFGRETALPRGPASLALHSDASVLLGIGARLPDDHFCGFVTPLYPDGVRVGNWSEPEIVQSFGRAMEDIVRRFPEQWLAFSPIWDARTPREHPATIERQTEAAV